MLSSTRPAATHGISGRAHVFHVRSQPVTNRTSGLPCFISTHPVHMLCLITVTSTSSWSVGSCKDWRHDRTRGEWARTCWLGLSIMATVCTLSFLHCMLWCWGWLKVKTCSILSANVFLQNRWKKTPEGISWPRFTWRVAVETRCYGVVNDLCVDEIDSRLQHGDVSSLFIQLKHVSRHPVRLAPEPIRRAYTQHQHATAINK